MSQRTKRYLTAFTLLVAIAGGLAGFFFVGERKAPAGAVQQVLSDVGRFRVGAELGQERAGFSGLPLLYVFANPDDPNWGNVQACLQDFAIVEELASFTPILVDARTDTETEIALRERGFQMVVRRLSGKVMGMLPVGFECAELLELLQLIPSQMIVTPQKSPIYARLLESPDVIDAMLQQGERNQAEKFVGFLREFEGEASPAVQAAEARLRG
jgi:hypothetical protein